MGSSPLTGALARLAAGVALGLPPAAMLFGGLYASADEAKFAALSAATLLSTALILVRLVSPLFGACLLASLSGGCAYVLAGLTDQHGVGAPLAGALVGLGAWFVAWLVQLTGPSAVPLRALLAGALFGGVVLAVGPLAGLGSMSLFDAVGPMILAAALAAVAGCGAALGVESIEWLLDGRTD